MSSIPQKKFTLYQYANRLNGKRYIGVTYDPSRRSASHAAGKSGARLFNWAVKKHGIEAFDHQVLAVFDDVSAAAYHEQAAIVAFGALAPGGYNLTSGAPGSGYGGPHSLETRAKMSAAQTGKYPDATTRAKLRASHMGQTHGPQSEEHKAKIGAANTGKKRTAEARAKMSASAKRRVASAETRAKMSAAKRKSIPKEGD